MRREKSISGQCFPTVPTSQNVLPLSDTMKKALFVVLTVIGLMITSPLQAMDEIKYERGQGESDVRMAYKLEILKSAMDKTIKSYGPYKISQNAPKLNTLRAQSALHEGELLNVYIALTDNDWEKAAIPIRIPIRRGILNYRLLLVHKDDLPTFTRVKTIGDLQKLTAGLLHSWTTTKVMKQAGFKVLQTNDYEGLFSMLDSHRFDYLPRGVNEIYGEVEQRKDTHKNIVIEPNLLLYIPSPTYVFVSPKYPALAKRLKEGLEIMMTDGTLEAIFYTHYADNIKKADLHNRHIIRLTNPLLPQETPLDRAELWFDPSTNL